MPLASVRKSIVRLTILLVIPGIALLRLGGRIDLRIVLAYLLLICGVDWLTYYYDKKRAEAGEWRIPELTLHAVDLLGGWPAAYVAQRVFRHKTKKASYRLRYWMIVLLHEIVALDYLLDWRLWNAVVQMVRG
jgi:uncharacterized membrane protein YsdA (DUF1294 family)